MGFLFRRSPRAEEPPRDVAETVELQAPLCLYTPPALNGAPVKYLVREAGPGFPAERYAFTLQIEIGRAEDGRPAAPGLLLVRDPSVSFRHCIVSQTPEGSCVVRDVSRNGTRVDGRRLVPNVESELRIGQSLDLGPGLHFVLEGEATAAATPPPAGGRGGTEVAPQLILATVLMGDIRDYTLMVRKAPSGPLQQSVGRVFDVMSEAVASLGGTVKEFPGDAMLAFWEGNFRGQMAVKACRAAIELERLGRKIATDPAIWALPDYPLHMDWALATGQVSLDSFGGATTLGLSLIGEPVVLACRLEKFATAKTGSILACPNTRDMVARALREPSPALAGGVPIVFTDLGEMQAKGFDRPDHVFAIKALHD